MAAQKPPTLVGGACHTDCGKNIHVDKNVFINTGCTIQDQGGVYIGDGALIGHHAMIATLNH
ncbi:hypothetical protein ACQ5RZ_09545 [Lactobacillus delbrueckii subsp. bulgaricus]|nr:hypothetical protein ME782_14440 [Lactobacillus delbrueckii]GHN49326.1 hypothetical protein ME800_09350 [Lactobacillus delbrueckii]